MFKLITLILIFAVISYGGFMYGETFRKREMQLKEILKCVIMLKNEIVYCAVPLGEALESCSIKSEEPIKNILICVSDILNKNNTDSVYDSFKKSFEKYKDSFYLKKNDFKILADFFKGLGESGIYGQESLFNMITEELKVNITDSEEVSKKNVKMYRYLGICVALMIDIFLI